MSPRQYNDYIDKLIHGDATEFEKLAKEAYEIHKIYNPVYRKYLELIGVMDKEIRSMNDIPFLPITFFKTKIDSLDFLDPSSIFRSSGTTQQIRSQHFISNELYYKESILNGFEQVFGHASEYQFFATLPSYEERNDASLIYMVDYLMASSAQSKKEYYLDRYQDLIEAISNTQKTPILVGVTFSLIDLCRFVLENNIQLKNADLIVIDTGGMKGRGEDMDRDSFYKLLQKSLNPKHLYSEYGMTELFSQSYAKHPQEYKTTSKKRVFPRLITDPLSQGKYGKMSGLNIIDLYNIDSCPFIATDDLAILSDNRHFRLYGRLAHSDLRGCQLMIVNED